MPARSSTWASTAEQRVHPAQGAVGQPHPDPVAGVLGLGVVVGQSERRRDERREPLDVGAEHHDVARFQGRVVVEQPHQQLPQHLDLALRTVGGVHLQAAVVRVQQRTLAVGPRIRRCRRCHVAAEPAGCGVPHRSDRGGGGRAAARR